MNMLLNFSILPDNIFVIFKRTLCLCSCNYNQTLVLCKFLLNTTLMQPFKKHSILQDWSTCHKKMFCGCNFCFDCPSKIEKFPHSGHELYLLRAPCYTFHSQDRTIFHNLLFSHSIIISVHGIASKLTRNEIFF